MSRDGRRALALVVGLTLLFVSAIAADQHCVKSNDRDLPCRAAARVVSFLAPQKR